MSAVIIGSLISLLVFVFRAFHEQRLRAERLEQAFAKVVAEIHDAQWLDITDLTPAAQTKLRGLGMSASYITAVDEVIG